MFDYTPITAINDFLFCPRSLYFHHCVYAQFSGTLYKALPQRRGTHAHVASDNGRYASRARYRQGTYIVSHTHRLVGKIDVYDTRAKTLVERKRHIQRVYRGYELQLMAQKLCLEEMGYAVRTLILHSLIDNKRYEVHATKSLQTILLSTLNTMHATHLENIPLADPEKCRNCIYRTLCRNDEDL